MDSLPPLIREKHRAEQRRQAIRLVITIATLPVLFIGVLTAIRLVENSAVITLQAPAAASPGGPIDSMGLRYKEVALGEVETRYYATWNTAAILYLQSDQAEDNTISAIARYGYGVMVIPASNSVDTLRAALAYVTSQSNIDTSRVGVIGPQSSEPVIKEAGLPCTCILLDGSETPESLLREFDAKEMFDWIARAESEAKSYVIRGNVAPSRTPDKWGHPEYEDITLTTSDALRLSGWYIPSRNKAAVILLHGYSGNRTTGLTSQAGWLAEAGYGVLMFDQRASGISEGEQRSWGWESVRDVGAAISYLETREDVEPDRIGVMGFSVGGQIAIRAAAEYLEIKAVFADGPSIVAVRDTFPLPSDRMDEFAYSWGIDRGLERELGISHPPLVIEVIGKLAPRPLLIVATGTTGEYLNAVNFLSYAGEPKYLWRVPDVGHGQAAGRHADEYQEQLLSFFEKALTD